MNVARESTKGPEPLTLTRTALGILDSLRGEVPGSAFVEELLSKEKKRRERESFTEMVYGVATIRGPRPAHLKR
jgi:hypothetical protein